MTMRESYVRGTLQEWPGQWLAIFDSFGRPSGFRAKDIKEYMPAGGNGTILFASRHASTAYLGKKVSIESMTENEAVELLLRRSEFEENYANRNRERSIVEAMGYLALAID